MESIDVMLEPVRAFLRQVGELLSAVDPLHMPIRIDGEPPETFPSGV